MTLQGGLRPQEARFDDLRESEALRDADLVGENRISAEVRLSVYRCLELAFDNVLQHARARKARIELDLPSERLFGEVSDDGVGFDGANRPRGLGLQVSELRIAALEAKLEIASTPGAGARLRFELPLARPSEATTQIVPLR